jgi:hypothetical protein
MSALSAGRSNSPCSIARRDANGKRGDHGQRVSPFEARRGGGGRLGPAVPDRSLATTRPGDGQNRAAAECDDSLGMTIHRSGVCRMRAMSLALMILFCTCHTAFAQSDTDHGCRCVRGSSPEKTCMTPLDCRNTSGRCVGIWPLPGGSYLWSCQSCKYDCSMLRCNCRTVSGKYVPAATNVGNCDFFSNQNGALACGQAPK